MDNFGDIISAVLQVLAACFGLGAGGGGLFALYKMWLQKQQDDRAFISQQFQSLLVERSQETAEKKRETDELRAKVVKLERTIDRMREESFDAIKLIIRLGGTWPPPDPSEEPPSCS